MATIANQIPSQDLRTPGPRTANELAEEVTQDFIRIAYIPSSLTIPGWNGTILNQSDAEWFTMRKDCSSVEKGILSQAIKILNDKLSSSLGKNAFRVTEISAPIFISPPPNAITKRIPVIAFAVSQSGKAEAIKALRKSN